MSPLSLLALRRVPYFSTTEGGLQNCEALAKLRQFVLWRHELFWSSQNVFYLYPSALQYVSPRLSLRGMPLLNVAVSPEPRNHTPHPVDTVIQVMWKSYFLLAITMLYPLLYTLVCIQNECFALVQQVEPTPYMYLISQPFHFRSTDENNYVRPGHT